MYYILGEKELSCDQWYLLGYGFIRIVQSVEKPYMPVQSGGRRICIRKGHTVLYY